MSSSGGCGLRVLSLCSDSQVVGLAPCQRGWGHGPQYPSQSEFPLLKLLSGSMSDPLPLHNCLSWLCSIRHSGRVSLGFLCCDCSLFSGFQSSSVSNNRSLLKMAHGYSTPRYGERQSGFLLQCCPAMKEESLSHKIPVLDLRLERPAGLSCS
jgi:hypothetical protein